MTIRAYSPVIFGGYGVSQSQTSFTNADIEYSLIDILINRDLPPVLQQRPPNEEQIVAFACTFAWRAKVLINSFNNSQLIIYNARTGKSKFGNYVTGIENYFVDDGFISYETFISPMYYGAIVFNFPSYEIPEIPCDEPPVEFPINLTRSRTLWMPGLNTLVTVEDRGTLGGRSDGRKISNSFFGYMENAVTSFDSAITYNFRCIPYTAEEFLEEFPAYLLL